MHGRRVENLIKQIEDIPTLPIISRKIMSLLNDENASTGKVAELIERDQSLAAKILKVSNSAFYGTLSRVSSIDNALVLLGFKEVRSILLSLAVKKFFTESENDDFDRSCFWRHAVICSQVAKYLARHFKIGRDDTLFLSGLLHDMGKVVLDQYAHGEFKQIIAYVSQNHESFSNAEKKILGITHYQVAAKLFQQWKFPEEVVMQVFYHHAPWSDRSFEAGSTIIYLANVFTKLAGYPSLPSEKEVEVSSFANSKTMDFIVKSGFDLDLESIRKLLYQIKEFIDKEAENMLSFFEE
jgi:putative nucleotidyltransferase with HDIG domain